ncbi:glycoside hydrolase family 16 protein [Chitinophaga pinensis]|uniref:Glycoside hydrolase family 16 protein n=1 Tax=Chitinophaga pinensis TaxID=79329 RepID=A0A5C6LN27_9BACT|nr:glycoside hydrolase family 16 protein [Chitinophaga pinensis]TWV96786.1 glycoside hydrolase family 16 protein [Chitinophaga pinensis]
MKRLKYLPFILLGINILSCSGKGDGGGSSPDPVRPQGPVDKGWTFETTPVWADEFDYTGLPDNTKWGYDLGGGGWGNNELEYYTNSLDNASVANGKLTITAKKEAKENRNYTSARLVTRGKGDFLYGRFEIKAKLPAGKGTWPAIWMLPTDWAYGDWPKSGEIDIMEHVGYDPDVIHITTHTEAYYFKIGTQKTATKKIANATTEYHLYRIDWTPYAISGYIDNQLIFKFVNEGKGYTVWPFDKKFHLLLNIAVGGDWGGAQGMDDSIYPVTMDVDYVRVYKMIEK